MPLTAGLRRQFSVLRYCCFAEALNLVATPKKVLVEVSGRGTIMLPKAYRDARASQAWFWSDRWQSIEREADAAIAAGRVRRFNSGDDLLGELKSL